MKVNEIERLLVRYYDGETSETEEKELKTLFYRRGRSGSFTCREGNLHATGSTARSRNTGRTGKQAEPQDRPMGHRRKTHAEIKNIYGPSACNG